MIFRRIELENFGIFYGTQALDLDRGLYILHGENGRGKTTIINAVKWAFFGSYDDRQGRPVSPDLTINRDASREGAERFMVTLVLQDDDGIEVLVRRTCEMAGGTDTNLYVERDGQALNKTEAQHLLRDLFDEKIVRFFLFDGEQLREYEELLYQEDDAAVQVKRSIEQILGLPVLENAIADLSQVASEIGRKIVKSARRDGKTKQLALQVEQLDSEIEAAERDLQALEEMRGKAEGEIDEADTVLQRHEAAEDVIKEMKTVEAEIAEIAKGRETSVADRGGALAGAWKDALFVAVAPARASLEVQRESQIEVEGAALRAAQIERSLAEGSCDLCKQKLEGAAGETLQSLLDHMATHETDGQPDLAESLIALSLIGETGEIGRAEQLDERVSEFNTREVSKKQDLARLSESVQGLPTADIRVAADKRDKAKEELGKVKDRIQIKDEEIAKKRQTQQDIVHKIGEGGASSELATLQAKEQLVVDLEQLCEAARSAYRDSLRAQVEADASKIFSQLTTEPDHTGLRINASYGLETLGPDEEPVPGRSAGQEQIVALSLIGALNRNAARRAPVMMDTPFGRLDEEHRKKVLEFLAEMADQVFLLVHSAEVSRADLDAIAADTTAELTLRRESAFRTELLPYDGDQ